MKHLFTTAAVLFSMTAFAQVGINNTSPKATLDITAKTSGTKPEGLIIPQLSGNNIHTATAAGVYGANQTGLIVYASSADTNPTGPTANITAAGYYYFDGTNWQKISTGNTVSTSLASGNIYVGSASNVATAVSPTGDVTISNTGATSIGAGKVTSSQIADGTVANADLATMSALTIKGNGTNAAAAPTDIAAGTDGYVLRRSGTALGFGTVATAGIADGAVTASKLNQMSATSGQVLGWNGSSWAPTASDNTNDAWINDTTNGLVKLGTKADGTARATGTDFVVKDNGQVGIGTSTPLTTLDTRQNPGNASPGNGAIAIGETTQAASTAGPGAIRYNTSSGGQLEYSNGTNWNTLTSTPKKSLVYGYLTSGQTVNNGGGTFAATEEFDQNNNFASNTFTVPRNGNYFVTLCALTNYLSWTGGNEFSIRVHKNGIPQVIGFWMAPGSANWYGGTCTSAAISASAGDQITFVYYNAGSAKTLTSDGFNKFSIQEL